MKKYLFLSVAVLLCLASFSGCDKTDKGAESLKIGITQIVDHPGINAVRQGFMDALKEAGYEDGKNVEIQFQNAQGDNQIQQNIAEKFVTSDLDLIFTISTPSTQALVRAVQRVRSQIPIVFGAVTDPVSAGIVESLKTPVHCTGVSDVWDYEAQFRLLLKIVPKAETVGIVYNPGEANSAFAMEQIQQAVEALNLKLQSVSVSNSGEVMTAAESIAGKVQAFYSSADNTIISAVESIVKVAQRYKIPVLAGELDSVKRGCLCTVGTDYHDGVGRPAGDIAVKILRGEKAGNIPVVQAMGSDVFLNLAAAQKIGLTVPENIIQQAKEVYK